MIQNLIEARIKAEREEDGLCVTQIQHWIIRYLDKNRGRDIFQKDLEGEFHASKATISSTLQVMERNGLLVRTAVGWDARLKKICLTEKALEFSRRSRENMLRMEALLRKGMSPEESAELMRLLRQVRYNLEQSRNPGQSESPSQDPGSERSESLVRSGSLDRSGNLQQQEIQEGEQ